MHLSVEIMHFSIEMYIDDQLLGVLIVALGLIIVFRLLRDILKRKPLPPSDANEDANLGSDLPSDNPVEIRDEASLNRGSVNPLNSISSFTGPGSSGNITHEGHDRAASVCSENLSAEWNSENLMNLQQLDNAVLRRRKFESVRQGDKDAVEMGHCKDLSINSPSGDMCVKSDESILKSDEKSITLYAELIRGSSSSDNILSRTLRSFNSSTNLDLLMVSAYYLTNSSLYSGSENLGELSMFRRRASQNFMPEIFCHGTPDDHLPLSFHRRRSHLGWMYFTHGFTIDSIEARSESCYKFIRDSPFAHRSCVSIDLGVRATVSELSCNAINNMEKLWDELKIIQSKMDKIRYKIRVMSMVSYISDLHGDRKQSCNAINSLEKLEDELNIIQSKMDKIWCKVVQLILQGWPQYKFCNFKVSVYRYKNLKPIHVPCQRMLYEVHQMPVFENLAF